MNIIYEKNIVFKYNCDRMNEKTFRKLTSKLAKKGIFLVSYSGTLNEENYGYIDVVKSTKKHNIMIPSLSSEPIMSWSWVSDAKRCVGGLEDYFDDVYYEAVVTEKIKKEWAETLGNTITMLDDDTLFNTPNKYESYCRNYFAYDFDIAGELEMTAKLETNYSHGLELSFNIEWTVDDKQTPAMIERVLDDLLLEDITSIKKIVDKVLKTKDFGVDVKLSPVGGVDMNCWSNTKIDVKQECSLESRQKLGGSQ
jgi:hypothetical protein|tara:strand:+ start:1547 stop:2305 length:759 start_codon:yes stop_codon:yes gene_type:complete